APPPQPGTTMDPFCDGGVNRGPYEYFEINLRASSRIFGVKSIRSSVFSPWRSNAAGFVGNGCVGEAFSPGTSEAATGRSSIGHTGFPVTRSKTKQNPCFVTWATAFTGFPSTTILTRFGAAGKSKSH